MAHPRSIPARRRTPDSDGSCIDCIDVSIPNLATKAVQHALDVDRGLASGTPSQRTTTQMSSSRHARRWSITLGGKRRSHLWPRSNPLGGSRWPTTVT
jgi:hypothetical protein